MYNGYVDPATWIFLSIMGTSFLIIPIEIWENNNLLKTWHNQVTIRFNPLIRKCYPFKIDLTKSGQLHLKPQPTPLFCFLFSPPLFASRLPLSWTHCQSTRPLARERLKVTHSDCSLWEFTEISWSLMLALSSCRSQASPIRSTLVWGTRFLFLDIFLVMMCRLMHFLSFRRWSPEFSGGQIFMPVFERDYGPNEIGRASSRERV